MMNNIGATSAHYQHAKMTLQEMLSLYKGAGFEQYTDRNLAQLYAMSPYMYVAGRVRAQAISRCKFEAWDGDVKLPTVHPLNVLVKHSFDMVNLMFRTELAMSFFGYSLAKIERAYTNRPLGLIYVNPTIILREIDNGGLHGWSVNPDYDTDRALIEALEGDDFIPYDCGWYVHDVDFYDDYDGVAPAEAAFRSVFASVEIDETTASVFHNMAIPAFAMQPTADSMMSTIQKPNEKDPMKKIRDVLAQMFKGAMNAGRALVTSERYEYHTLQPAFKDLDTSTIDLQLAKKIAAAFNVPLSFILPSEVNSGLSRNEDGYIWAYSWILPRADWYAGSMTESFGKWYGTDIQIKVVEDSVPFIQPTPEMKNKIVGERIEMGVLSLQKAQMMLEGEVTPELEAVPELLKVGDDWIPITDVSGWAQKKLDARGQSSWGNQSSAIASTEQPPQPQLPAQVESDKSKHYVPYEWHTELDLFKSKMRKGATPDKFTFEVVPQHVVRYIQEHWQADADSGDVLKQARERMAIKAIQSTRLDYEADIELLLERAIAGRMSEAVFRDRMRAIHRRWISVAYEDGLIDGGVIDATLSDDDRAEINRQITAQTAYIRDFARALYSNDNTITEDEIAGKPAMWWNKSVMPAYFEGLASANRNANYEWVYGDTEHCADCRRLNGQVHRMRDWQRRVLPQDSSLECGGFNCSCRLVRSDSRARGSF